VRYVFRFLRPHVPRMILGFLVKFTGTIVELALPMILSFMIDDVVPTGDRRGIFLWGGIMLFCCLVALFGNIIANRMAARVARNTTEKIRSALFERISYLSSRQVDSFTIPSLESRLTSDTYNIHQMIGMMQRMGVRAPILLIGGIGARTPIRSIAGACDDAGHGGHAASDLHGGLFRVPSGNSALPGFAGIH